MKKGIEELRLILFTFDAELNPQFVEVQTERQKAMNLLEGRCSDCLSPPDLEPKQKGRALLKYDEFKSSWSIVAVDVVNANWEFRSDWVGKYLRNG